MKFDSKEKSSPKKNAGFYIALALCVTAVGGAAWTTYSSVLDYQTPDTEASESSEMTESSAENTPADKTVSGVEYSRTELSAESSESSEQAANTALEVSEEKTTEESSEDEAHETSEAEFVKPIDGEIIKEYSPENPVYSKTMGDWRTHDGVDISADDGEKVSAYTDGTVTEVYNDELLGYSVKIKHTNGITMTYSGLSPNVLVSEGDSVSCDDCIGAVFTVPSEIMDEVHLHLSAEKDGSSVDVQKLFEQMN